MAFASYSVRRAVWPLWRWEASYCGEATARGYSMTKMSARRAARGWLRNMSAGRSGESIPVAVPMQSVAAE